MMNWTDLLNPNYPVLAPALILVITMLVVMLADLWVKEKRALVWAALAGDLLAMGSVFFAATDKAVTDALTAGQPLEVFGGAIVADRFTFFLQAVLLGIVAMVILLSMDYVERFLRGMYLEFYEVIFAATLGMMLMVSSRDILTIYVGLELSSICSYILAGLLRHDAKSNESALKYFLNGALASAVLLFGLSLVYGVTGTTYLPEIGDKVAAYTQQGVSFVPLLATGAIFLVGGFAFKVAAAPVHLWAPDAYEGAPTPVTGFFSVGPKGAAFGAILRVFLIALGANGFSNKWMIMWAVLATASMFIGNLTALMQSNIKRMMAYSSIAQAGYVLVGVVAAGKLGAGYGTAAVLYYVLGYAITNLGIFAVLTHMDQEGGWVSVRDFDGLFSRNPLYAVSLFFFFVSLIGIPPTVGFFGKFFLFRAALDGNYLWLAIVMAVNSVISVGYYYGVVKAMFLEKTDKGPLKPSIGATAAVVLSLIGVIAVGLAANPFLTVALSAAGK